MAKKTIFSKTVIISSIAADGKTSTSDSANTNFITEDDKGKYAPFTNALIMNKTSQTDITKTILRARLNDKLDNPFDVPANNGTAVIESENFDYISLENTDGATQIDEVLVIVSKEVDV